MEIRPVLPLVLLLLSGCSGSEAGADAKEPAEPPRPDMDSPEFLRQIMSPAEADPDAARGVTVNEEGALDGYTLFAPLTSTKVYLVDNSGEVVHTWEADSAPGACVYLLDDGMLLRAGREDEDPHFNGGGIGGRIQKLAPDGTVAWHHGLADYDECQHHDLEPLPNGNVLVTVWERKSAEEAIAAGRDPRGVGKVGLWPDSVYELAPILPTGAEVVWEWHAWDHLVQDFDPEKPNYGVIADHPGRIDVNANFVPEEELSEEEKRAREELEKQMAAIGYGGGDVEEEEENDDGPPPHQWDKSGDWLHTNSVDYHPELDLIVLSTPELCELWVIDHSTTTEEAAGSTGGRWGRGGDLLWRWGNPVTYGAGDEDDRHLYYQHNPTWLLAAEDLRLLVFNNGGGRPDGNYSSVEELVLPFDPERGFLREPGEPFGPAEPAWSYSDPDTFFSAFISGAQRLPNGNTFVCSGTAGRLFELTPEKEIVWDFLNPLGGEVETPAHTPGAPKHALFRGTRLPADHPGVRAILR